MDSEGCIYVYLCIHIDVKIINKKEAIIMGGLGEA